MAARLLPLSFSDRVSGQVMLPLLFLRRELKVSAFQFAEQAFEGDRQHLQKPGHSNIHLVQV